MKIVLQEIHIFPQNNVHFRLEIFGLKDNMFRFKIREAFPISERFEVPEVLASDPEQAPITLEDNSDHGFSVVLGNSRAVITAKPFKIEVFSNGVLVVSGNSRGLLKFEHTRLKATEGEEVLKNSFLKVYYNLKPSKGR